MQPDPMNFMGLAHHVATEHRWAWRRAGYHDLVQAAFLGIIRGCELYDPSFGAAPMTYLYYWARAKCQRLAQRSHSTIKLPTHWPQVIHPGTGLYKRYDHKTRQAVRRALKCRSLDEMYTRTHDEGQEWELEDIPDPSIGPDDIIDQLSIHEALTAALAVLNERQAAVLHLRSQDNTLEQIGEIMGVTRERIRQIECRALWKVRDYLKRHYPQFYATYDTGEPTCRPNHRAFYKPFSSNTRLPGTPSSSPTSSRPLAKPGT